MNVSVNNKIDPVFEEVRFVDLKKDKVRQTKMSPLQAGQGGATRRHEQGARTLMKHSIILYDEAPSKLW